MADYINPQSIDPYANVQANPEMYVQTPAAILGQLQNRQIAEQMYQNALANQQLDLEAAQRKGVAETQMEDILSRVRTDPRYGQALQQAMISEQLGKGGEAGLRYLQAVQEARDVTMAPMFETQDPRVREYLLRTGGQTLGQLGLTSPELPSELTQAFPILQAQNVRYRRGQEFQAKRDLQQQEIDARMALERYQQQEQTRRAGMRPTTAGGEGPKENTPIQIARATWMRMTGRVPSSVQDWNEIAGMLGSLPQNVPELAGEKKSAQLQADPMYAITQGIVGRLKQSRPDLFGGTQAPTIPQRGAAPVQPQPAPVKRDAKGRIVLD